MLRKLSVLLIAMSSLFATNAGAATHHRRVRWFQPIMSLPKSTLPTWRCVLQRESHSTFAQPNRGDNNRWGSSGIFQIEQGTWAAHQLAVHVPARVHVWQASPYQQAEVAAAIWRADGFAPWGLYDGC